MSKDISIKNEHKAKRTLDANTINICIGCIGLLLILAIAFGSLFVGSSDATVGLEESPGSQAIMMSMKNIYFNNSSDGQLPMRYMTNAQRQEAAIRIAGEKILAAKKNGASQVKATGAGIKIAALTPGGIPDYFGTIPNFANSPLPGDGNTSVAFTGGNGTGATAIATVNGGVVTGINLTNGGSNYTSAPTVTIPGIGSGATALLTMSGYVNVINIISGGGGYTSVPTVNIIGGGGSGATANATGSVDAIAVLSSGSGYLAPVMVIYPPAPGGITATATANGSVDNIVAGSPGSGYTAPVVVIDPPTTPGGITATATANGSVDNIVVGSPGSGYTAPVVVIDPPATPGGIMATATANGSVDHIVVVSPGSGYTAPVVVIDPPATPGGITATATATKNSNGNITLITLINRGSGYLSAPIVRITGNNTTVATASSTVNISRLTLVNGGSGYLSAPIVGITGTNTTLATASSTVNVSKITLVNGGSGYATSPNLSITGTNTTHATAFSTINITNITLLNGGSGYVSAPIISITGINTTRASATSTINVSSITLISSGSGYTSDPSVTFTGGADTGASASATIRYIVNSVILTNGGSGYIIGGIRKFVDSLPGLTPAGANNLGQYIPVAVADSTTYPGSDYYEIALVEYTEKMHSDLNPTLIRGYVQLETSVITGNHTPLNYLNCTPILNASRGQVYAVDNPHYLGPLILAQKDRPVRIKFTNYLPTGTDGDLFIPVDTSVMGSGPYEINLTNYTNPTTVSGMFSQNRAVIHLHGGNTPWISDGTQHQWITPAGENTSYPKGASVAYVPDMWFNATTGKTVPAGTAGATNNPGNGSLTYYYTNQQSARLMFYHDHAYGITRLNVYAGEAAGYIVQDPAEQILVNGGNLVNAAGINLTIAPGTIPADQIPLVIQDKTFLPDAAQLAAQDPTWPFALNSSRNDIYYPHVYMPNQNPADIMGASPMGRWDYGPWFFPPQTTLTYGPVPNPLYGTTPQEGPVNPGTPNPSLVPESFVDTPIVNGNAYPYTWIGQKAYRLRILNAANDRGLNLQLYYASTASPFVLISGGDGSGVSATAMVNATNGSITGITMTSRGVGYTVAPEITIFDAQGHGGSGATATATIGTDPSNIYTFGTVTNITVTANGSGYSVSTICNGTAVPNQSLCTEVSMVPATEGTGIEFPLSWLQHSIPTKPADIMDNRIGGIPNPAAIGPSMIQIGTEGGFLPAPAVIENRPVGFENNGRSITVTNIMWKALLLGPAERADVIVDFSGVANGSTLMLYNDAPAPVPAGDTRNDYFTNDMDQTSTGGASSTIPGYGPNTRTVMQIRINGALGNMSGNASGFNLTNLTEALPAAYVQYQDKPLVPQAGYNDAFNATYPDDAYARIESHNMTFLPASATQPVRSIKVTNGGNNYTSAPIVNITGGNGTNATATSSLAIAGVVKNVIVSNQGSSYTSIPTVTISAPTTAGGITATARATINTTTRIVTGISITNPGSGYTSIPTVTISAPTGPGPRTTATATAELGFAVASITVTNGGSGHTSAPIVIITGGNGSGASATATLNLTMDLQPKALHELFDPDYGRMNSLIGVELPLVNWIIQTTIPYSDIDPPTELFQNSDAASPIGSLADGTQIWKITHNGVDTHALHWHMFNVQVINRVGWDGAIKAPDANELGWKETVRMNPLEDIIVAFRPIKPDIPWDIPNSIRPQDVTMPLGSTGQFGTVNGGMVDPAGLPVTVNNHLINYGWEYVWHCHLLGHEENIMMRSMLFVVTPNAPIDLTVSLIDRTTGSTTNRSLSDATITWTDNSTNEINFTVQRSTINISDGPWTTLYTLISTTGPTKGTKYSWTDSGLNKAEYYYRVIASNIVGDVTQYAAPAVGFESMTVNSTPTNIVGFPMLNITANRTNMIVGTSLSVTFNVTSGGIPVSSATVTVNGAGVSTNGLTNAYGSVTLSVRPTSVGIITATASKANYVNGITTLTTALPMLVISANMTNVTVGTTYPVQFTVTSGSVAVNNAAVTLSGLVTATGTTNSAGIVIFSVYANRTGIIIATASKAGYTSGNTKINDTDYYAATVVNITTIANKTVIVNATNTTKVLLSLNSTIGANLSVNITTSTNASVLGIDPLARAYGLGTSATLIGEYISLNTSGINASNASSWNTVNLTLYYNKSLISPAQAATLRIYWYNRITGIWWPLGPGVAPLPNLTSQGGPKVTYSVLNTTGGYVLVTVNHLSEYVLGADPELSISASSTSVTAGRPKDVTFTITGAGLAVSDATVTLSGVADGSGKTDVNGNAIIRVNATGEGIITVTANMTGYISGTTTIHAGEAETGTPVLVSSITPNSRNAQVGTPVTIFMTVINGGTATATDVGIIQASGLPVTVSYQQWDGTAFTGLANTPSDIAAGAQADYVLTINAISEFESSSLTFNVSGTNIGAATINAVNTLTIAASETPYADDIMMSTNMNVSAQLYNWKDIAVATTNVGEDATGVSFNVVVPSSITGLITQVNETNSITGEIIGQATGLTIDEGAQTTFAVFLYPTRPIAFDPTNNRIILQLVDGAGKVIGAQSVAISTP